MCKYLSSIMTRVLWITVLVLVCCAALAAAQSNAERRCFQFTWLGPQYNQDSVFLNATCQDATRLASGVPCQRPLVASLDGTWPDVEYIWTHHSLEASCVLSATDVCAQYTYYFNGIAENSTYLCTRAVDQHGHSITSGCFQSNNGSSSVKVCFCRSIPGGVPCNGSNSTVASFTIVLTLYLMFNKRVLNWFISSIL